MIDYTKYTLQKENIILDSKALEYFLEKIGKSKAEFLNEFSYGESKEKLEGIKNFLKYKIIVELGIVEKDYSDCDCMAKVKEEIVNYLLNKGYNAKNCNERYIEVEGKLFETDTANSVQTMFGEYLRNYLSEKIYSKEDSKYTDFVSEYTSGYGFPKKVEYRDYFFLQNIEKWYNLADEEDKKIFEKFSLLASIYHTLGNVILVPIGFNMGRNRIFKDYLNFSLEYLDKLLNIADNELYKCITGYDIMQECFKNIDKLPKTNADINNYLDAMIGYITKRNETFTLSNK